MNARLFHRFSEIAYQQAGIRLREGKEMLVAARVAKRQRALGLDSQESYLDYLENEETGEEIRNFLDAISTNYTSFFRERDHFEFFGRALNQWRLQRRTRLRVWCAASSTGEEPYSIAMTALDAFQGRAVDFRILATDISTRVLMRATAGVYPESRLSPLSRSQIANYFVRRGEGGDYQVRPEVQRLIVFKRLNLSLPRLPMNGPLDMVFCRNVMMYFDLQVRQRLVGEIVRLLRPGGFLVIGHAESLGELRARLDILRPSLYRKPLD